MESKKRWTGITRADVGLLQEMMVQAASQAGKLEVVHFLVKECSDIDLNATDKVCLVFAPVGTRHEFVCHRMVAQHCMVQAVLESSRWCAFW